MSRARSRAKVSATMAPGRFHPVGASRGAPWWLFVGLPYYLTVGWLIEPLRWVGSADRRARRLRIKAASVRLADWQKRLEEAQHCTAHEQVVEAWQERDRQWTDYQRARHSAQLEPSRGGPCTCCGRPAPGDVSVCEYCGAPRET